MYAGGPGGAFRAVGKAGTVILVNGGGGGTDGGGGGVGNWVDNGVFPGFRILKGVPPEGFEGCLGLEPLLLSCFLCDCDLDDCDLALPPPPFLK